MYTAPQLLRNICSSVRSTHRSRRMTTSHTVDTLAVSTTLTDAQKKRLTDVFKTVHHYPEKKFPQEILKDIDYFFTNWEGIPHEVKLSDLPRLKHLQITSAGVDKLMQHPDIKATEGKVPFSIGNATGIHVLSIPSYVVNVITSINQQLPATILVTRNEKRWPSRKDIVGSNEDYFIRTLRGKTVGMLGYGHLGRETARLLQAFGCKIIAANSNGQRREDDGFILEGTGDKDCSIPEQMYSTSDETSFNEFLSKSKILVASLPSTAGTRWMLDADKLGRLQENAIFVNVGRGDLIKSEEILKALEKPNGLFGVALDVTDPEPLTDGHPLFSHPRVIITPHVSGDTEGEKDFTIDLVLANREKLVKCEKVFNDVDLKRGY